jgi:hypothetical protein
LGDTVLTWKEAHEKIEGNLTPGTYLGIKEFQGVFITGLNRDGFEVSIGENRTFNLKWFILEHSWKTMNERRVFNLEIFKELFGEDCLNNPACVDIVGRIFLRAGLAKYHENIYHNYTERLFHQLQLQFENRSRGWG